MSVIGAMPTILRAALVMSDLVMSVFSLISCLIVPALVMFFMCSSGVVVPCSKLMSLWCMDSNLFSKLFSMVSTMSHLADAFSVLCYFLSQSSNRLCDLFGAFFVGLGDGVDFCLNFTHVFTEGSVKDGVKLINGFFVHRHSG